MWITILRLFHIQAEIIAGAEIIEIEPMGDILFRNIHKIRFIITVEHIPYILKTTFAAKGFFRFFKSLRIGKGFAGTVCGQYGGNVVAFPHQLCSVCG